MVWKLGDPNKSGTYILPMLGRQLKEFRTSTGPRSQYVNCFVGDHTTDYKDKIFLLYRYSGSLEYSQFETLLHSHPNFFGMYDPDTYHVMYVFDVPEEFKEDYEKFKKGKYSEFSESYKRRIQEFFNLTDNSHPVIGTLYKLESGYKYLEDILNKGIHRNSKFYLRIPRHQEASSIPELEVGKEIRFIEIYQDRFKVVSAMNKEAELQEHP